MPVEVQWAMLDTKLLGSFWAKRSSIRRSLFDKAEHVMVFHRGIGVVRGGCLLGCSHLWPAALLLVVGSRMCSASCMV